MKRCSNPNCESSFLYGDNKTNCPFCHAPLIRSDNISAGQPLISPIDAVFESAPIDQPASFINHYMGGMECTGRIIEIEHQALFYSKLHKLFNTIIRGEPFQLAHQSVEYTIRVKPITDGIPTEITDFCLYGNYLGRLQVGDEVRIKAKDCSHRRVVKSITNLSTNSPVKPGLQISASIIRTALLSLLVVFAMLAYLIVQFFSSGVASALFVSLIVAVMPVVICVAGLWLLLRSIFPSRKGRRRW